MPRPAALCVALLLLGGLTARAEEAGGERGAVEIIEPASDAVVTPGTVSVRFLLRPEGEGWPADPEGIAAGVFLDGGEMLGMQRAEGCAARRVEASCVFSHELAVEEEGQHLVAVRLLVLSTEEGVEEDWDLVWEASAVFEVAGVPGIAVAAAASPSQAADAGSPVGPKIVFESPGRVKSSFLDPSNVTIRFRVDPPGGLADVEVSSRLVASGVDVGAPAAVRLPPLPPDHYSVTVWLRGAGGGARTGVSETANFHVWPDHSWVKGTVAAGSGLSSVRAGERGTFSITARDREGALSADGGDWFLVRLVGPAITSADVVHVGGAEYVASYLAAEEGEYELHVELHYDKGAGLLNYGDESPRDVVGWHIHGSPFKLRVLPAPDNRPPPLNPYGPVPFCADARGLPSDGGVLAGRWVAKAHCSAAGLACKDSAEEDDEYVWLPWRCKLRGLTRAALEACAAEGGGFNVLMAGTSQQRTLFFDVGRLLGSTANQPRKYWTDLEAPDVSPKLFFHWMIPGYDAEGTLDYPSLLEGLGEFVRRHAASPRDVLIVQASVHDIHLGSLDEYPAHMRQMAAFLAGTGLRVLFRGGDALHIPPGGRSIIERGLRDPRIRRVNDEARAAMEAHGVPFIDTHASTIGRPDRCVDGYHYFDRDTETLDALGLEICIGNAVARTQAQVLLNFVCPAANATGAGARGARDGEL